VQLQPITGPLSIPQIIHERVMSIIGMVLTRVKLKNSEKNLSQCHFIQCKLHMNCPDVNFGMANLLYTAVFAAKNCK
jgi:hypothetical protein